MGMRSVALRLPYTDLGAGLGRIRLIRKACYFDGLLNGRFEILIGLEHAAADRRVALAVGDGLADTSVTIRFQNGDGAVTVPLRAAGSYAARLWAQATVAHGVDPVAAGLMARRPVCVIESDQPISKVRALRSLAVRAAAIAAREGVNFEDLRLCLAAEPSISAPRIDHLLISASDRVLSNPEKNYFCRYCCRYLRTYTFRILQDIECLSILLNDEAIDIEDGRVQNLLNEYTRRIYRSHQRLDDFAASDLVRMAYASFETLYPGRIDSLRVKVQSSRIRPNVGKKLMLLFDQSQSASIIMAETLSMELIMGDQYKNVDVTGSQGVAIGRGASAKVEGSSNVNAEQLSSELLALADTILAHKDKPDADIEATLVKAAAEKAKAGDEAGAAGLLKKSASWVLDIAKTTGSAVLAAFVKSSIGI